jgi:transcriptional regulator with XRE-family HTH domain
MQRNARPTRASVDSKELRKRAGAWLKSRRQDAGLSQMDLATGLGLRYYTFVSQVENGFGRVPSESMGQWAHYLGIPSAAFARKLLSFYDPHLYRLLFGDELP